MVMSDGLIYYGEQPTGAEIKPMPVATKPVDGIAVLILCSGIIHPWEGDSPRQLREIGKETILNRTMRQVEGAGHEPVIITQRDDIRAGTPDVAHFEPEYKRTIAETWLYTRELWGKQTIVLLGDTIYGNATLAHLMGYRGSFIVMGDSAEIYAFTFPDTQHDKIAKTLYKVNNETWKGSPHFIYRLWCGRPYDQHGIENKVFQWVKDRTGDIDTPNKYKGAKTVQWG